MFLSFVQFRSRKKSFQFFCISIAEVISGGLPLRIIIIIRINAFNIMIITLIIVIMNFNFP